MRFHSVRRRPSEEALENCHADHGKIGGKVIRFPIQISQGRRDKDRVHASWIRGRPEGRVR